MGVWHHRLGALYRYLATHQHATDQETRAESRTLDGIRDRQNESDTKERRGYYGEEISLLWNPSKRGKIVLWTICLVIWIPLLWFYGILDFGVLDFREKRDEVHPFDQAFDTEAWRHREAEKRAYQHRAYADRLRDAGQRIAARAEEVRMEKWKSNFPYRPTTDPAVMRDPEVNYSTLDGPGPPYMENVRMAIRDNHNYLSGFYADDVLYTVQFEKMYGILAE